MNKKKRRKLLREMGVERVKYTPTGSVSFRGDNLNSLLGIMLNNLDTGEPHILNEILRDESKISHQKMIRRNR